MTLLSPSTAHPRAIQKLNFAADVLILAFACFVAAVHDREIHWKVAIVMTATAATLWAAASRTLHHYDVDNGRSFFGDLALTLVLVAAVVVPLALLRFVVPHYAMTT